MAWVILNTKGECVSACEELAEAADRVDRFNDEYPDEAPFTREEAETYKTAVTMMREESRKRRQRVASRSGE